MQIFVLIGIAAVFLLTSETSYANKNRPFRGSVEVNVILCTYKDALSPQRGRAHYRDLYVNLGTGGNADFWNEISFGGIDFKGSFVTGWHTINKTVEQAKATNRSQKIKDCLSTAQSNGYQPKNGSFKIYVTSPTIDAFGGHGYAFLGEDSSVGLISHEVGHALSLNHSFSDDPNYRNASWAAIGEYDNQWDIMSYANVYTTNTQNYGDGGPGASAYHRDRMGWLGRNKIKRFGADGLYSRTLTLSALNHPEVSGYQLIRIPFDTTDRNRYYTVEYRVNDGWDEGIGGSNRADSVVLISEVKKLNNKNYYVSYLLRDHHGSRQPKKTINRNGISIEVLSTNRTRKQATVRIKSNVADRCVSGLVWREANRHDRVCVTPHRRRVVSLENDLHTARRNPNGGAYGPQTCKRGFVWREAYTDDKVCVTPKSRQTVKTENRFRLGRTISGATYGPNTCKKGYVWREADRSDWVCVSRKRREAVRAENRVADKRRSPHGGPYGENTCIKGFVWREAFPEDYVCVTKASRAQAQKENRMAFGRLKNPGA